ncbi:hypothetical protein [Sorangium sp. So ce233]|uniref:hypothetical protein n=1 Tax=Sorangium sp. So ce233 TaxID=3133290 RepID=UPI003F5FCCCD
MSRAIDTDDFSARLRRKAVRVPERQLLIARIAGSEQEADLRKPPNCGGFGRIRHFFRDHGVDWPRNPLPIDPASRALGLSAGDQLHAQVFQNAACNWRCWYCFVPFRLLDANESAACWLTADDLVDFYLAEPEAMRPKMIDLTGGQPELVPEWVPWTMHALRKRGLEGSVYLWSDDNLSNDYFWRYLSDADRELIANFRGYGRVACFKGFDELSFSFNTEADPSLFGRQFDLYARYLRTGIDLYAYVTLTTPSDSGIEDAVARFMDRLQALHENLPLRTVPLKIGVFGVVKKRLARAGARADRRITAEVNQFRAVEAWSRELERRFSSELRARSVMDVPIGKV